MHGGKKKRRLIWRCVQWLEPRAHARPKTTGPERIGHTVSQVSDDPCPRFHRISLPPHAVLPRHMSAFGVDVEKITAPLPLIPSVI